MVRRREEGQRPPASGSATLYLSHEETESGPPSDQSNGSNSWAACPAQHLCIHSPEVSCVVVGGGPVRDTQDRRWMQRWLGRARSQLLEPFDCVCGGLALSPRGSDKV
uniref:Uncharacterized protein n=1 Tax=Knipowitschia caucasica TaxID=637954 RepID=A0AAV2M1U8_KNICA